MAIQTDPVCSMQFDHQNASAKSQHQGTTYYFCSADCKRNFDQKPERYAAKLSQVSGQASEAPAQNARQ